MMMMMMVAGIRNGEGQGFEGCAAQWKRRCLGNAAADASAHLTRTVRSNAAWKAGYRVVGLQCMHHRIQWGQCGHSAAAPRKQAGEMDVEGG